MAAEACFDPRVAPLVWERMQKVHDEHELRYNKLHLPQMWPSTHPADTNRRFVLSFIADFNGIPLC